MKEDPLPDGDAPNDVGNPSSPTPPLPHHHHPPLPRSPLLLFLFILLLLAPLNPPHDMQLKSI
eukprot:8863207-Pyramimonas_sp.AAC.1